VGGGGSLMTHSVGSVPLKVKLQMGWLLNHTGTPEFKIGHGHTLRFPFFKTHIVEAGKITCTHDS
jgi:hypothetical protein